MDGKTLHIMETVDRLRDEILDFTCRIVAEPSTVGNEVPALQVMEAELGKLGFDPVRVPLEPDLLSRHPGFAPVPWPNEGRYNVVARREASGAGGRSAIFNGHLDVVSPEPIASWKTDPFEPILEDGWLYGRGAADMKSGVAAMTYAVHAMEKAGFGLRAPVTLECVIEEECSGNGTLACLLAGYDAEAVLIPEPFGPTILTDQLGVLWFKVVIRGTAAHALDVGSGNNAIEKGFILIAALRELEKQMNEAAVSASFRGIDHPLNLNIGSFAGGDWPSTVPAMAEFHGRMAFFPEMSYQEACRRINEAIQGAARRDPWLSQVPPVVEFYGLRSEGFSIPRDLPALITLNECHRCLAGEDAESLKLAATTDCRVFYHFGKGQATCYGARGKGIHAENECVDMESVFHASKVYALFLSRWCGLVD
ncbi:MAG: ArgE/DapE family deacylase [Thermodesulfobacteriota bacterium]